MTDSVESLILEHLHGLRAGQDRLENELREVAARLTSLEAGTAVPLGVIVPPMEPNFAAACHVRLNTSERMTLNFGYCPRNSCPRNSLSPKFEYDKSRLRLKNMRLPCHIPRCRRRHAMPTGQEKASIVNVEGSCTSGASGAPYRTGHPDWNLFRKLISSYICCQNC